MKLVINTIILIGSFLIPTELGMMTQPEFFPAIQPKTQIPMVQVVEKKKKQKSIDQLVEHYAELHDLDPELILAMIEIESTRNHSARSPKGAIGVMQLMPDTAEWLGVNPYILEENIKGGTKYIAQLKKRYKDLRLALAAYNAGPGNVDKYGSVPPFTETINYVKKICSIYGECGQV